MTGLKGGLDRVRTVRIGLLGLGTVGQAVVQLTQHFDSTSFRIVRAAVRSHEKFRAVTVPITDRPEEVLEDPAIDVIVEVAGGREPARHWILEALANGKSVVTANKEVMAYHGPELLKTSHTYQSFLGYEAAVAGGIPIVDPLRTHLTTAPVQQIYGVLNGTTNYLLCAMAEGRSLNEALLEAQQSGFAEQDPSADILGWDSARKLVLLIHLAFRRWVDPEEFDVRGLEHWPAQLFNTLAQRNLGIRLVAMARRGHNGRIEAQVRPTVVRRDDPLMGVVGAQNGIGVVTAAGHFWLQGPGAGGLPTATSIWSDIRRAQQFDWSQDEPPSDLSKERAESATLPLLSLALDPDRPVGPDQTHGEGLLSFPFWELL